MQRMVIWSVCILAAGGMAVAGLAGCSEESEICLQADEGEFVFFFDPVLKSGPDSTANIQRTIPDALLTDILSFPNSVPPVIIYRFDIPTTQIPLDLTVEDLGRTLPLTEDSTYVLEVDMTQRLVPPSMGLKIYDSQGLVFLGVNDWRPASDSRAEVFQGGYGDLGSDGELEVFFVNDGCDPSVENTQCFRSKTNYRLDFSVGGSSLLGLWNREEGQIGSWIFHVHKSVFVLAKACGLEEQNGVSFVIERDGAR